MYLEETFSEHLGLGAQSNYKNITEKKLPHNKRACTSR
jgi:hypothetical protein